MKTRIIDKLSTSGYRRSTDEVWRHYSHYLVTAFGDLLIQDGRNEQVVRQVYCEQRVRSLDQETIEGLIYTLPPAFVDLKNESFPESDVHWGASSISPFILLGHVGTGKSTFLDYMFLCKIPKTDPSVRAIIVNFLKSEDNHDDFSRYLLVRINSELSKIDPHLADIGYGLMEELFASEIASYKSTLRSKQKQEDKISELLSDYVDAHLPGKEGKFKELIRRKIKYLQGKGLKLWIILDNVDQHHSCLQNDALVSAISTASTFHCHLVIVMRYISLATPAAKHTYNSYRPRKLKLSFPDAPTLLKRRLAYFEQLSTEVLDKSLKWTGFTLTVQDLLDDVKKTIDLLSDKEFMDGYLLPLSNFNMRRLLEIVLSIFQSYYFFFDRFNNQRYVPNKVTLKKRFLHAHLLKNEDYFGIERDEKESFVLNLFENENKAFPFNQTIRIRLLQGLMSIGKCTTLSELTRLILGTFNYEEYDLLQAYRAFLKVEMFAIRGDLTREWSDNIFHEGFAREHMFEDLHVSLTHAGSLHYSLLETMEYIEIMRFSTYADEQIVGAIQNDRSNLTIHDRMNATKKFARYFVAEERKEIETGVIDAAKFKSFFGPVGPKIVNAVESGIAEIQRIAS